MPISTRLQEFLHNITYVKRSNKIQVSHKVLSKMRSIVKQVHNNRTLRRFTSCLLLMQEAAMDCSHYVCKDLLAFLQFQTETSVHDHVVHKKSMRIGTKTCSSKNLSPTTRNMLQPANKSHSKHAVACSSGRLLHVIQPKYLLLSPLHEAAAAPVREVQDVNVNPPIYYLPRIYPSSSSLPRGTSSSISKLGNLCHKCDFLMMPNARHCR